MESFISGKVHDLSLTLHDWMKGVSFETARKLEVDGWNAQTLQLYSHIGTHMDAPFHFGLEGTIDEFTPDQFIGPAWIVEIPDTQPQQIIFPEDLGEVKEAVRPGDSLILKTSWSQYVGTDLYRNGLPRVSEALAKWCCEKNIKMLGVEPPSVADVNNLEEVSLIHHILLDGGVIIVEGLTNLDAIQTKQVWLIALPLKIYQGDGAPARVIAIEP